MDGFNRDAFLKNAKSGREALKFSLPSKTRRQEGSPLNKVWLRVARPSMHPFVQATSSQMRGGSESPATLHSKRRWSSKIVATLP